MKKRENRDVFIDLGDDCFEMRDYRTCYATIRKQTHCSDLKHGRDPNKYCVYLSIGPVLDDIDTVELSKKVAFKTINDIMDRRYGIKKQNNIVQTAQVAV